MKEKRYNIESKNRVILQIKEKEANFCILKQYTGQLPKIV